MLCVPKKSKTNEKKWRIVFDYRKLNEVTIPDVFPLPNITDILDKLGCSHYFSTIDLAHGYHQVPIDPEDREKTAFSTDSGHYQFTRMSMGLRNAPSTFQRLMNSVLCGLNGLKCLVYLDDVVIYGKSLHEHNQNLNEVFSNLKNYNLKVNPEKCQFLCKQIYYLGHLITESGVKPDPKKLKL